MSRDDDALFLTMDPFVRAACFAALKHRDQRRKNGDFPYFNHPVRVATVLWVEGEVRDGTTLAAALLHDTVEDTETTRDELESEFGAEIADAVMEVTDDTTLSKAERKRAQIAHAPHLSEPARQVKLADKIDNLRDLIELPPPAWTPERVRGYFCWASTVVDGLRREDCALTAIIDDLLARDVPLPQGDVRAVPEDPAARSAVLDAYLTML